MQKDTDVIGSQLNLNYTEVTNMLAEKHMTNGRIFGKTAVNLDSFDNARCNTSTTAPVCMTSFSMT